MSQVWARLLLRISKDKKFAREILETIPTVFRPRNIRKAFANAKEQAQWIKDVIAKLGGPSPEAWRHVRSLFALMDKLDELPAGSADEILAFLKNMKNLPAKDVRHVMEMTDLLRKAIFWDHTKILIRLPNGKLGMIIPTDEFGARLEARIVAVLRSGGKRIVNLNTKKFKVNFPGVDVVVISPHRVDIGQITHGSVQSLLRKFKKLLNLDPAVAVDKARDEMIQVLVKNKWCKGPKDFLRKARLIIPEELAEPLRTIIKNHPDVASWCKQTGMSVDDLLRVVQGMPGIPP
jgi:hypothetical protein